MKHYSKTEWIDYIEDRAAVHERSNMEDHLLNCEECLTSYLELLECDEKYNYGKLVTDDFTESVMNKVNSLQTRVSNGINKKKLLVYYTAAACLTLILMGSGVFNIISRTVPSTTAAIVKSSVKIEATFEKIKSSDLIVNNLKISNILKGKQ